MEEFIYNETDETQEELLVNPNEEEDASNNEEGETQNPNGDDGEPWGQEQQLFNDGWNEDRNGDGIVDATHISDDTDGDGIVDFEGHYYDDNFDGEIDMVLEYSDQDGDGYLETENVQSAQGGSAVINFWKNSADVNHDGTFDIIEVQQDTNASGSVDTYSLEMDTDGDGSIDFAMKGVDYNEDGEFDSERIYEDSNSNGAFDTMTEIYDSNNDGKLDRAEIHHDYDEDGKDDWTQICEYDPKSGMVTPLNDPPSYAGAIGGTFAEELERFEPQPDYPAGITGDPKTSMEEWENQGMTNRCALYSQKFVIEEFTGVEINMEEFAEVADYNGWFTDDFGTTFLNMNKMLDYYGIENKMSFHNNVDDIEECLEDGGKVIVSIDADEIWYGEGDDLFSPNSGANHAVEVIGIDRTDPEHPMVILNDSGNPNGKGVMIPLADFEDAWQDGECQMIECYPNKK